MSVPERFGVTAEIGDIVEVTLIGRVESWGADGLYLTHEASCTTGAFPAHVIASIVNLTPPPAPDAHTFAAGDLVASDADLDRPYVRTRQADGSWLTPKGFRSSVTDSYMSARVEAGEFWRVDASNPNQAVPYALIEEKYTPGDDYFEALVRWNTEAASHAGIPRAVVDQPTRTPRDIINDGLARIAADNDWERELLSSPNLVTLPEVDATPRFKVGADYYHPSYPDTHYTREVGGWRSHEVRFSPIPRLLADESPYLTPSWVDGLMPVAS